MNQDPGCSLAISVPADGAVAEVPTRRTLPMRVLESLAGILAVAVPQTASAELTPDPDTFSAPTNGLGVRSLLSALVARGPDAGVVLLLPAVMNLL